MVDNLAAIQNLSLYCQAGDYTQELYRFSKHFQQGLPKRQCSKRKQGNHT